MKIRGLVARRRVRCCWLRVSAGLPAATTVLMPIEDIRPGMVGVGRTVFDGTELEDSRPTSSACSRTSSGPQRNLILAKLEGGPLAETGVIAGMSGSPVYIDGTLIGAVSYSLGSVPEGADRRHHADCRDDRRDRRDIAARDVGAGPSRVADHARRPGDSRPSGVGAYGNVRRSTSATWRSTAASFTAVITTASWSTATSGATTALPGTSRSARFRR